MIDPTPGALFVGKIHPTSSGSPDQYSLTVEKVFLKTSSICFDSLAVESVIAEGSKQRAPVNQFPVYPCSSTPNNNNASSRQYQPTAAKSIQCGTNTNYKPIDNSSISMDHRLYYFTCPYG